MIVLDMKYKVDNDIDYEKFVPYVMKRMFINMKFVGKVVEYKIRKEMRSGKYEKNTEPWAAAKNSNRSLYHTGHLSTKIDNLIIMGKGDNFVVLKVGWLTNPKHPARPQGSGGLKTIVNWITTEHTWQPTAPQRRAFWAQVPSEWKAQNPPKQQGDWYSPARDFMSTVANDPHNHVMFLKAVIKSTTEVLEGKR